MYGGGMTAGWLGGLMGYIAILMWIVWLVVGILLIVWLWQKITKK